MPLGAASIPFPVTWKDKGFPQYSLCLTAYPDLSDPVPLTSQGSRCRRGGHLSLLPPPPGGSGLIPVLGAVVCQGSKQKGDMRDEVFIGVFSEEPEALVP